MAHLLHTARRTVMANANPQSSNCGLVGFRTEGVAMSFGLYSIGYAILIIGLIYGAHLMHVPPHWIAVLAIVLLGAGILSGVKATRQRDPAE
jgi:hypothetical protein